MQTSYFACMLTLSNVNQVNDLYCDLYAKNSQILTFCCRGHSCFNFHKQTRLLICKERHCKIALYKALGALVIKINRERNRSFITMYMTHSLGFISNDMQLFESTVNKTKVAPSDKCKRLIEIRRFQ